MKKLFFGLFASLSLILSGCDLMHFSLLPTGGSSKSSTTEQELTEESTSEVVNINYGTRDNPLDLYDAGQEILKLKDNSVSPEPFYIVGTLRGELSVINGHCSFTLFDRSEFIDVSDALSSFDAFEGDRVLIYTFVKYFRQTLLGIEWNGLNPTILSVNEQ